MAAINIRVLRGNDLSFADSLRSLVGWNQTLSDWRRLTRHDPEGCFIAEWNKQPAGTVTTTQYSGQLAWIGMLLVHPDFRRRGIGRALLERSIKHLGNTGVQCIKLDATPEGLPLYEQIGFKREWTLCRWQHSGLSGAKAGVAVRQATAHDFDAIEKLDANSFGLTRRRLLKGLVAEASLVLVANREGELDAFGVIRKGARASYLGPISALSAEKGRNIAAGLMGNLDPGQPVFWDVPTPNAAAMTLARESGFTLQRELTRMYLGRNVSCRVEQMFGIGGPEVG